MSPEPELKDVQAWMQWVITHPGGVAAGVEAPEAWGRLGLDFKSLEQVITSSPECPSAERLSIYNSAYFARLIECLQVEFPAVHHAVGEPAFSSFVVGYLRTYPSVSYTLSDLSRNFAKYLEEIRPPREGNADSPDWADFIIELAALERLYAEVFDGPGEEHLPKLSLERLQEIPMERHAAVVLIPAPSLRFARFRFPVHEYISAVRHGQIIPIPSPEQTCLAVYRRDYIVRRVPLSEAQFSLLRELCMGRPLVESIKNVVVSGKGTLHEIAPALVEWLTDWTRSGFFVDVRSGVPQRES